VMRSLAVASLAGLLIACFQRFVVGKPIDWPFVALMIVGVALALMVDKVRFHRRMAWLFREVAENRMSPRELFLLARRDPEVREALIAWGKREPQILEALRHEGLYP
jgi:hypothetical protein